MHSEIAEEKLLVSQFSQGSHIAFKALFMRYYPTVSYTHLTLPTT